MFNKKSVAAVVPAYNEEKFIGKVITTMPDFVDKIIVIDDVSKDKTKEIVKEYMKTNKKVILIEHEKNQGVGGSIISGYKKALELNIDVAAVMAGDAQMHPEDLKTVIAPVLNGEADYVKGNRLFHKDVQKTMPQLRYFGNSVLTLLTKIASGYWYIMDP
ncbi:MAG: glycosyltransferase family 2 protein, partial [Nanoarchaeota archaeon]